MKITYLGTAAAEGFPGIFCNCEYCNEARRLGGKNIRTRSQTLINDDLLIDFPADSYMHFLNNGIEGDKIKYLLVTHAHPDHLYSGDFLMRRSGCYSHNLRVPTLRIISSKSTLQKLSAIPDNIELTPVSAYETIELDSYRITALPARHMLESADSCAFIYIIQGDKNLLYAHDTGCFYEEVFDYIEKNRIKLDMLTLDCTNVNIPISDDRGHMGFPNIERVLDRLCKIGAITESTVKYVNHFSHNANPIHHILEKRAEAYGCSVSYDGCRVEL